MWICRNCLVLLASTSVLAGGCDGLLEESDPVELSAPPAAPQAPPPPSPQAHPGASPGAPATQVQPSQAPTNLPAAGGIVAKQPNGTSPGAQAPAGPGQAGQGGQAQPAGQAQPQGQGQAQGSSKTLEIPVPGFGNLSLPVPVAPAKASGTNDRRRGAPERNSLAPPPPGSVDGAGMMTATFLQTEAKNIHGQLVAALREQERNRVAAIPLSIASDAREPNAVAGCTKSKRPVLAVTMAMLTLAAGIAEAQAYDELAGTNHADTYAKTLVSQMQSRQTLSRVHPALLSGPLATDAHKLARQRQLYAQQVAFIVGHELAHHYRGHTGCASTHGTAPEQVEVEELARIVSHTLPLFSQPREVEADMWSIGNVLDAGSAAAPMQWNEEGALLNLDFFGRLRSLASADLVIAFLSTHPLPQVRAPIVRSAAEQWRPGQPPFGLPTSLSTIPGASDQGSAGGLPLPIPFPLPLPQ